MTRHIDEFSALRFVAAFWVFLSHVLLIVETPIKILSSGDWAVDVFVILSGFVITLLILRRPEPYFGYMFRRLARLYPLYIVALFLGIATQHLYQPVIGASLFGLPADPNFDHRVAAVNGNFFSQLSLHLLMLHGAVPSSILPLSPLAFSGPLWSISLEWQFYIFAPVLIWCLDVRSLKRFPIAIIVLLLIFGTCLFVRPRWHESVPSFLPLRLPLFAAGILSGLFWERAQRSNLFMVGLCLAIMSGFLWFSGFVKLPLIMWSFVYFVAATSGRNVICTWISKVLCTKPLVWLGERSYGLYVLHMPIVLAFASVVVVPHAHEIGRSGAILLLLTCYIFVVALASVLYRSVERPVTNWAKRIEAAAFQLPAIGRGPTRPE